MQKMNTKVIALAERTKMQQASSELEKYFEHYTTNGEPVDCPFCHYISANKRFSGKIWVKEGIKSFKCFSCGEWRRILNG